MELSEVRKIMETGKFIRVRFTKRDGSERVLIGRSGVSKGTNGVGLPYCKYAKGIVILADMELIRSGVEVKDAYRAVKLDSIKELKAGGEEFFLKQ